MSDYILPINIKNTNLVGYSGYINIFDLSGNYQSGRGISLTLNNGESLTANYSNNYLIVSKPTVTNRVEYFTNMSGVYVPKNLFESNLYQQKNTDLLHNFIFNGIIVNNSLHTDYTNPYTFQAFIRAFNSNFSSLLGSVFSPVNQLGNFSIQFDATSIPNIAHIEWGFVMNGYPVYTTEAGNQGLVTIMNSYKNWGVVGSFTGWGTIPDILMQETFTGSNIFEVMLDETFYGPFKFRLNSDWGYNYGGNWDTGILSANTNLINPPDINAPRLSAGYRYVLTLNLNTYTFTKEIRRYEAACLLEGTLVWTANGYVPIETLKVGDSIRTKHFYIDIVKVGKWSVDLNQEEDRNDLSKKMYKIPAGQYGATSDTYISHYHRILVDENPGSETESRVYHLPTKLGLGAAEPTEVSMDHGKYNLYHLQLAVGNHFVVNGGCMVEAWKPDAKHF